MPAFDTKQNFAVPPVIPALPRVRRARRMLWSCTALAWVSGASAFAQPPTSYSTVSAVRRVANLSLPEDSHVPLRSSASGSDSTHSVNSLNGSASQPPANASADPPAGLPAGLPAKGPSSNNFDEPAARLAMLSEFQLSTPVSGEPAVPAGLTVESLEAMGLASNPSIARAAAAVSAARGTAVQVGLQLNPVVGYEGQQIGSGGLAEQHGVMIGQEFLRHEKRTLSREVACREVQMAEHRLAAQRARVSTDIRMAFYHTVRAQRQIDVSTDLLRISEQALKAAQSLFEAKEIARTDVLQAQIEVDVAKTALEIARNQHVSAWSQLAAVTGQSQLPQQPLSGDLFASPTPLEFEAVLAWLRSQSPEISLAWSNVQRARAYLQRQIVEPRPNVSVQTLVNAVDNGINGKPDGAVGVSLPLPLWNKNQGAIQQARYDVVVAEQSLAQLELSLQQRLAPVYERYANAKNLVEQYGQRILPAAAETLSLTQKTFEVGEIGFTNLLIVQRSYRQQQLTYLDAAEALRLAEAEINGLLLTGSLTTSLVQ